MRHLPLYGERPASPLETAQPLDLDSNCARCALRTGTESVCLPADGVPGGLLVVGVNPSKHDDRRGRPFVGRSGTAVRRIVEQVWDGPVVYDFATRCARGRRELGPKEVEACRPYLAGTFRDARPGRIIALGTYAVNAVVGRSVQPLHARKGVGWIHHPEHNEPIPVFYVQDPAEAYRNRILASWFREDLHWAMTAEPPPPPPYDATYAEIETLEDSVEAVAEIREEAGDMGDGVTYDVETAGLSHSDYDEIVTLAITVNGTDRAWVWERDACNDDAVMEPVLQLLADPGIPKSAHNEKFDRRRIASRYGVKVGGFDVDTRLMRKLDQAYVDGSLAVVEELVGMGGSKAEMAAELKNAQTKITKARTQATKGHSFLPGVFDPALVAAARYPDADWEAFGYALVDPAVRARYCALDTVATARLRDYLVPKIEAQPNLVNIWTKVVRPLGPALAQVEGWGIRVDKGAVDNFRSFVSMQLGEVDRRLKSYGDINYSSSDQLGELLFTKLGLPVIERSDKTGKPGTGKSVLKKLEGKHPIITDIGEYRRLDKLLDAYGRMDRWIVADGRIHPSFKIDGTECMPAGELVHTSRGVVPVEQVRVGDEVLTHEGRSRPVTASRRFDATPIVRISTDAGHELRTSGNHQYWTPRGWVRADELRTGDQVFASDAEAWRPIEGWPYEVSSWGRVRRIGSARCLKQFPKGRWGHLKVCLSRNGAQKRGPDRKDFSIHRLVADAFGAAGKGPEVRHLNGVAWDNRAANLQRGTRLDNAGDAVRHGSMRKRTSEQAKLTPAQVAEMRAAPRPPRGGRGRWKRSEDDWVSDSEFAKRFGVSRRLVGQVRTFDRWEAQTAAEVAPSWATVRVVEAHTEPPEAVIGLTVAEDESHLTGGLVTHNTGRLSCLDPNLQQIPRADTVEAKMIKDCFVAGPGYRLLQLDYSQLEYRIAAMLAMDPVMIKLFLDGIDFHLGTAQLISEVFWGIRPEDVQKQHRSQSKTFNFGLLFGMTDGGMAARMGCSKAEAARLRAAIMGKWNALAKWIKGAQSECKRTGYAHTWWDGEPARRRPLWNIASNENGFRINAENASVNTPVQGTAADYTLASIPMIVDWLVRSEVPAKLVLTVHDSIIFEVREDAIDHVARTAIDIMESHPSRGVPLKVDAEVGRSWGSLKAYDVPAA